jgi:Flp pilus assembly protein TadD
MGCGGGGRPTNVPTTASPSPAASSVPVASATASTDIPKPSGTGGPVSDEAARGIKALQIGDLATAKAALEAAVKKNPKDAESHFYLGTTLDKGGDKAGAEREYKAALEIKPDLDEAAQNLAAMYIDSAKFDDAIKLTKSALAKHPDDLMLRENLAIAYAGKGDEKAARKAFDEAMKINANDPTLLFTYGHWLAQWKDTEGAIAKLRAARAASSDVGLLLGIAHEMRTIGAFGDCVPTLDKAIATKDAAELRVERGLCKIGAKDESGATADFQAAVTKDINAGPAHFYLGNALARQGKWDDAIREYEAYLKIDPNGPLAKQATERLNLAKAKKAGGKK